VIEEVKAESPWQMDAIVLLPDHLHMLWKTPPHDLDYSTRIAVLKKRFTDTFLKAGGRECRVLSGQTRHRRRGVWQERFWEHTIRDLKDYRLHLDYIHSNPVKHGLVELPIEWPWSSFHRYVKQGLYERDWCGHVELPGTVEYLEGF
jgi:putative transposase